MWVVISGSIGTGKEKLIENLSENGYEYLGFNHSELKNEFDFITHRYLVSKQVDSKKNYVSNRCIYDSLVFAKANLRCGLISNEEYKEILKRIEEFEILNVPDIFVYTKTETKQDSHNRRLLRGERDVYLNDSFLNALDEEYEKFFEMVTTSKFEMITSGPLNRVLEDFNFYISSIKTTKLSEQTIWKKDFINAIWME